MANELFDLTQLFQKFQKRDLVKLQTFEVHVDGIFTYIFKNLVRTLLKLR